LQSEVNIRLRKILLAGLLACASVTAAAARPNVLVIISTRSLEHRWAIDGWWKLIAPDPRNRPNAKPELYDLILLKKCSGQKATMKNTTKSPQYDRESCV
jgi:hypothetical protein